MHYVILSIRTSSIVFLRNYLYNLIFFKRAFQCKSNGKENKKGFEVVFVNNKDKK